MPCGNGTGPLGIGPGTGRGAGVCGGPSEAGKTRASEKGVWGRGWGCGGHGHRHMYYLTGLPGWMRGSSEPLTPDQELTVLKQRAEHLGKAMEAVQSRIRELEDWPPRS